MIKDNNDGKRKKFLILALAIAFAILISFSLLFFLGSTRKGQEQSVKAAQSKVLIEEQNKRNAENYQAMQESLKNWGGSATKSEKPAN